MALSGSKLALPPPTGLQIKHITVRLETWRMKEWSDNWRDHKDYIPPYTLLDDHEISKLARKIHQISTIDDLAHFTQTVHFNAIAPSLLEAIKSNQKNILVQAGSSTTKRRIAPTDLELEDIVNRLTLWRTKVWREDWKDTYRWYSPENLICNDDLDIIARDIHEVFTFDDVYQRGSILHIRELAPGLLEELERIRNDIFGQQPAVQIPDLVDAVVIKEEIQEVPRRGSLEHLANGSEASNPCGSSSNQNLDLNSHSDQFEIVPSFESGSDSSIVLSSAPPQTLGGTQIMEITQRLDAWRVKEWSDNWRNQEEPPLVHHLLRDGDISIIARKINKIFTKDDLSAYTQIYHLDEMAPRVLNEIRNIRADIESQCRTSRSKKVLRPTEVQVEEIVKRLSAWRLKTWFEDWKDAYPFYSPLTLVSDDDLDIIARDIHEVFTTDDLYHRAGIVHHNKIAPVLLEEVVHIRTEMFGEQAKVESLDDDHILVSDGEREDEKWVLVDA